MFKEETYMVGLLIVMAITLLICIVFMASLLALNVKQEKAFEAYRALTEDRFQRSDEVEHNVLETLDAYPKLFKELIAEADEIYRSSKDILAVANEKAEHSRKTIQAARMLQTQLLEKKAETFRYEEPEDDPDNPRS